MLGMGMASSHAPMMFQKAQYWPRVLERIPAEAREHLPQSARVEIATPAIIDGHIQRIEAAFATLRDQLKAFQPDALLMIGDDQGDMFDMANNPTFSVYTGDEPLWGRSARDPFGVAPQERTKVVFRHAGFPDDEPEYDFGSVSLTWALIVARLKDVVEAGGVPNPALS